MLYYKVPIIDGTMDIDYDYLLNGIAISQDEAVVELRDGADIRESWEEITQSEFESYRRPEEEPIPKPTLEERIDQLQQDNLLLMLALTDIYEKIGGDK